MKRAYFGSYEKQIFKKGAVLISLGLGDHNRWDIGITTEGNFAMVSEIDQLVQLLRNRLLFIKNEWRYNNSIGVPYFEHILINSPNFETIESIFKKTVLETKEVERLIESDLKLEKHNLKYYFKVKSVFGNVEGNI